MEQASNFERQFAEFRNHIEEDDSTVKGYVQSLEVKCRRYRQERDEEAKRANEEVRRANEEAKRARELLLQV
jgi:hypothetical protein